MVEQSPPGPPEPPQGESLGEITRRLKDTLRSRRVAADQMQNRLIQSLHPSFGPTVESYGAEMELLGEDVDRVTWILGLYTLRDEGKLDEPQIREIYNAAREQRKTLGGTEEPDIDRD
jgi:hypothetical protein